MEQSDDNGDSQFLIRKVVINIQHGNAASMHNGNLGLGRVYFLFFCNWMVASFVQAQL